MARLTNTDFCRAAKKLKCEVAAIKAVASVESKGDAFYSDGFPVILFERHKFYKYAKASVKKNWKLYPDICNPASGGYGRAGQNQRNKFNRAFALDPIAAMKACSWGMFQIMGFNHAAAGYGTVGAFVDAMKESESKQLDAFVSFIISNSLAKYLKNLDWAGFASRYNGIGYKANKYDTKMAAAYKKFLKEDISCGGTVAKTVSSEPLGLRDSGTDSAVTVDSAESVVINETGAGQNGGVKVDVQDGNVSVETNTQPPTPTERVAVVAPKPKKWYSGLGTKITSAITGNALFIWLADRLQTLVGVVSDPIFWYVIIGLVALGTVIWLWHEARENSKQNDRDAELVKLTLEQNSTQTNLVETIAYDDVALYRMRGYRILPTGDSIPQPTGHEPGEA